MQSSKTYYASVVGEEGDSAVKYLSSSRLLALQLRDAAFRQDFMLQVLVFLQSVRILSKGVSKSLKPKQVRCWD